MNSIENFLSNVYSEELYGFSEEEYSEVMAASAVEESDDYAGYSDWSAEIEAKFEVVDGKLHVDGKPHTSLESGPHIGGIEI